MLSKRTAALIALLALPALILSAAPVVAQNRGWSEPVVVSGSESSWFPDVAVGPDGSAHIVFSSSKPREGEVYAWDLLGYRRLQGGEWSSINDIFVTGAAGEVARTSIISGRDGELHALVRGGFRIDYIHAPGDAASSALDWSAPRRINNARLVYYDELAADSAGVLHAVWTENAPSDPDRDNVGCPFCSELYYRHTRDGGLTWSAPLNLSQMPEGSDKPHIEVDALDRVHVVWDEGQDRFGDSDPKNGAYRRSDDGGNTWQPTILFSLPDDAVQQTTLGIGRDDMLVVVYRSTKTDVMYYQLSRDGGNTWSAPAPIPGVRARSPNDTPYDHYTMAADGGGNVHLVFAGYLAGDSSSIPPRLLRMVWNGSAWSAPEIVESNALYPEWPNMVIDRGNQIHLVWFTRSKTSLYRIISEDPYLIWYSTQAISAPVITPLPSFTPMPSPTPQPTFTPVPSPTLLPRLESGNVASAGVTSQPELDSQASTLLIVTGIPVAALAAIIWFARRARR